MNCAVNFETLYQDDDIIVVNKPSGLLCVPGLSHPDNLYDQVKRQFPNARVVHRLDMSTSGLMIFALHYEAQKILGKSFEQRRIQKTYSALVFGQLSASSGEIHSPLICDWPNRPKQKIDWLGGKAASTSFLVITTNQDNNTSHVRLFPHSGRTHQLRVHMMQLGHPILGDNFYACLQAQQKHHRLCLHAEQLEFNHPATQAPLRVHCPASFI